MLTGVALVLRLGMFGTPGHWRRIVPAVAFVTVAAVGLPAGASAAQTGPVGGSLANQPLPSAPTTETAIEPTTAPDAVSARAIARLSGRPVEVIGERSTAGSVFALPDGTMAAGFASGPVWVRQGGDGTSEDDWAAVDLTLAAGDDGVVRPVAHPGGLELAGGTGGLSDDVELVRVTDPETGVSSGLWWQGSLPEPVLEGRRATYREVEPGVDLVLEATSDGFEQFFVVKERPQGGADLTFPLTVESDGGDVEVEDSGALRITAGGQVVAEGPTPLMWDAQADAARETPVTQPPVVEPVTSDEGLLASMPAWASAPVQQDDLADSPTGAPDGELPGDTSAVEIDRAVEVIGDDTVEVVLTPQEEFLQDPDTVFPVVVDPSMYLTLSFDTYVLKGYSNPRSTDAELEVGTYDGGAHVARAFLHFTTDAILGKDILEAELSLANFHSWSCSPRDWQVWSTSPATSSTVWDNQPALIDLWATSSDTYGYSSACAPNRARADVTDLAQKWADNATGGTHAIAIRAANESDNFGWKKFYSANNGFPENVPMLWVNYNSYPDTPTALKVTPSVTASGGGETWTPTLTPKLSATVDDADGGTLSATFVLADEDKSEIWRDTVTTPSGQAPSVTVPAGKLAHAGTYNFRVATKDSASLWGESSAWFTFRVDTVKPKAPSISSAIYPDDNTWNGAPGLAGQFQLTQNAVDGGLTVYRWGLDKAPDPAQTVEVENGLSGTVKATPKSAGRHVLQVQAVDHAGNVSGISEYVFRVGKGGILAPENGTRIVRQVRLFTEAEPGLGYVSYEWRRGPDAPTTGGVPVGHLTTAEGATWTTSWSPLPAAGSYTTWDAGATLGFEPGVLQVRAQLSATPTGSSPTPTDWVSLVVDPDASGAATTGIGPGSVNLLTGDHSLSGTDVEEFGLSIVRTASSRDTDVGVELQVDKLDTATQDATGGTTVVSSTTATRTVATNRWHTGTTSFQITPAATGGTNGTYVSVGAASGTLALGMQPGRTYRVSGWVYVPTNTGLSPDNTSRGLKIVAFTKTASVTKEYQTKKPAVLNAWTRVSVDIPVPTDATETFVRLYNGFDTGKTVNVYFDDLSVREVWSPFGPQWQLGSVDGASGAAYTKVTRPYDDVVAVHTTGGGQIWFSKGSDGEVWWPEPGAEALTLTAESPTAWRLTHLDGTVTTFTKNAATKDFPVASSSPPGAPGEARYVYDTASVPGVSRLSRIIAPIEPGVDGWPGNSNACTTATPARGCEALELTYATTTTAKSYAPGSFIGRVDTVSAWSWNPATSTTSKFAVATYSYDTTGLLVGVSDPRAGQQTTYGYDTAGRVTQVDAAGDAPWTFTYAVGGATKTGAGDWIDTSLGRLVKVSHGSLVQGSPDDWGPDNTTTLVYEVPLTRAAGGPYDLNAAALASWAQHDAPTDATAVFGPLDVPNLTTAKSYDPGVNGYKPATVHYLNGSGLEVNTASPAGAGAPVQGFLDTTEYDRYGNTVRTLDATNRLLALGSYPGAQDMLEAWNLVDASGAPLDSVTLAQLLDSRSAYSEDGIDLLTELGPVQQLAVGNNANDVRLLRPWTQHTYDQGKPDGGTYHLETTTLGAGKDPTTGALVDQISTVSGYDPIDGADPLGGSSGWVHKQATSITVAAGTSSALTSTVLYDATGRPARSSKPGSNGQDAATVFTVFYTAGTNSADAACGNKPEWAGQPCVTKQAGDVTGHDPTRMNTKLPVKRVTGYNRWGSPTVVTDEVGAASRTAATTYDAADRIVKVELLGTGAGEAIATTTTAYDSTTGAVVANASVNAAGAQTAVVTKEYDELGRLVQYTDAAGGWTRTEYDRLGQPVKVTDSIGTTRTYEYDRTVEPRGFVTKITDSVAGVIVPTWGADGQLESQTMPGGVKLTIGYDTARVPVSRTYTRISDGAVIASDQVLENHRGQWISHTTLDAGTRTYGYDLLGRLTAVDDQSTNGTCTSRRYGYDTHTNRTSASTSSAQGTCPGLTGASTVTSTYDSADRLVATSSGNGEAWTYDAFGRITAMPTPDASAVAATGYYVNDLVASQEVPGVKRTAWTLDPVLRLAGQHDFAWVNGAWVNDTEQVMHFDGDGDEPAWIVPDATLPNEVVRFAEGADGSMAVQASATGDRVLQLVDLHGDVTATIPIANGANEATWTDLRANSFDEFGVPQSMTSGTSPNGPPARYGWLGAAQRSADTPTGVVLMGVRLYAPTIGRFLQVDPVIAGSANAYDYCNADPVNCTDLAGTFSLKGLVKAIAVVGEVASFIPGPIGAAGAAASAVAYAASGNRGKALEMGVVAAAQLVGAGAAAYGAIKVVSLAIKAGAQARSVPRASRALGAVKAVARRVVGAGKRGCNSFAPGTQVVMADGSLRAIEEVAPGDEVRTMDPRTGDIAVEPVIYPIRGSGEKHLVTVVLRDGGRIDATFDHRVFVEGDGWTAAGMLRHGQHLRDSDGRAVVVTHVQDHGLVSGQTVHNLHTAGAHTYFVNASHFTNVLVHNDACRLPKSAWAQDVYQHWDRGSFPSRMQSILYHYAKHGRPGQSFKEYATQGVELAKRVGATGSRVRIRGSGGGIVGYHGRTFSAW